MLHDVGFTFMYDRYEYKVIHRNENKNRISIERLPGEIKQLSINEIIKIEGNIYRVSYINSGKERITLDLL